MSNIKVIIQRAMSIHYGSVSIHYGLDRLHTLFIRNSFIKKLYWTATWLKKLSVLKPWRSRNLKLFLLFSYLQWLPLKKYPCYVVQTLIVKVHITPLTKFVQRTLVESKDHIQKISRIGLGISLQLSFSSFEKIQNYDVTSGNHY